MPARQPCRGPHSREIYWQKQPEKSQFAENSAGQIGSGSRYPCPKFEPGVRNCQRASLIDGNIAADYSAAEILAR
jgi:hypothetical protein